MAATSSRRLPGITRRMWPSCAPASPVQSASWGARRLPSRAGRTSPAASSSFCASRHARQGGHCPPSGSWTCATRQAVTRARVAQPGRTHVPRGAGPRGQGESAVILSAVLDRAIRRRLEREEQTILLLNRRGYSSFVQCRECGDVHSCVACSVSLTYHRVSRRLLCHHCRHEEPAPDRCPRCGGKNLSLRGLGTEQVERSVAESFPDARIARHGRRHDLAQMGPQRDPGTRRQGRDRQSCSVPR